MKTRTIIGTCGLCGGPVEACELGGNGNEVHCSVPARCLTCGATVRKFGPLVMDMADRRGLGRPTIARARWVGEHPTPKP